LWAVARRAAYITVGQWSFLGLGKRFRPAYLDHDAGIEARDQRLTVAWGASPMIKLRVLAAASAISLATGLLTAAPAEADASAVGEWSAPFPMGGVAIHATLTHNGDVLFFQYVEGSASTDHTSYIATWNYQTGETLEAPIGYHRDIFCAHQNVLPDGRVFVAGGHDHNTGKKQSAIGVAETDLWDPIARTWTPGPLLTEKRWYPTNVMLADGKTLVFGGHYTNSQPSNTVDEYDPATNTIRTLANSATLPMGLYPRMHLLADGRVVRAGPQRKTMFFNPATESWTAGPRMLYGPRKQDGSVLLPGGKVLAVGGALTSRSEAPTNTVEILDTSVAKPTWRYTGSMTYARSFPNLVTLPDGKVLAVGGETKFKYIGPIKTAEMYDPTTESWSVMASQQASRGYHGTALLLPDGRVLSAGQDNGPLATYGEIYSPPYLFKGPRPTISAAPAEAVPGQSITVTTPDAADIQRVVLIRPSSTTHSIDVDQRSVPLDFTATSDGLTAGIPTNTNVVPDGYYMLFIVNGQGVPSVATWVHVS
jgi:hypothetical protein